MKKNTTTADMEIKQLQQDIKRLSDELAATEKLADYYADRYESSEKLMKFHSLVLVIMSLVYQYTDADDMGRAIRTNINRYYKGLTADLMNIPGDDTASLYDNEFEDDEYDDGEKDKDGEDEL
jgi:hypothetical protein